MDSKIFNEHDLKEFKSLIVKAQKIVVTCHVRPDGDAMGSSMGMAYVLRSLGKDAVVVTPDMTPRNLWFMPGFKDVVAATRYPDYAQTLIDGADLIICCDFNQPSRQDKLAGPIQGATCPKVLIDHHEEPSDFADLTFSFPKMSSTCELVFRIVCAMGMACDIDKDAAICLCTGLITDTRNFSVNCSNPEVYEILLKLIEKGADKQAIVKETLETQSLNSVRLQAYAMSQRLEIFPDHHSAIVTLTREDLDRFNYERGDSEGLVNEPLKIRGMVYCFFLREEAEMVKVSARSICNFPVNRICSDYFGGGGHIMAAGGEYTEGPAEGRLQRCHDILVEAMNHFDDEIRRINPEKI